MTSHFHSKGTPKQLNSHLDFVTWINLLFRLIKYNHDHAHFFFECNFFTHKWIFPRSRALYHLFTRFELFKIKRVRVRPYAVVWVYPRFLITTFNCKIALSRSKAELSRTWESIFIITFVYAMRKVFLIYLIYPIVNLHAYENNNQK